MARFLKYTDPSGDACLLNLDLVYHVYPATRWDAEAKTTVLDEDHCIARVAHSTPFHDAGTTIMEEASVTLDCSVEKLIELVGGTIRTDTGRYNP